MFLSAVALMDSEDRFRYTWRRAVAYSKVYTLDSQKAVW